MLDCTRAWSKHRRSRLKFVVPIWMFLKARVRRLFWGNKGVKASYTPDRLYKNQYPPLFLARELEFNQPDTTYFDLSSKFCSGACRSCHRVGLGQ